MLSSLPSGVVWSPSDVVEIERDEQTRLWWGRTPLDLFFRASPYHDDVAERLQWHPFADQTLPFHAALDLAVFMSLFDRPKDWIDIEAMCDAEAIDTPQVASLVRSLIGDDQRVHKLMALSA